MHYDLKDILYHWQYDYCSGCHMPESFRQTASNAFSEAFLECGGLKEYEHAYKTNSVIYRVHGLNSEDESILKFDGLYYSFSNNIAGLNKVVKFDKNLTYSLIIIEAKPQDALNFNELHNEVFGFYPEKFAKENEILSKLSKSNVINIYYLKDSKDIFNYKTEGIKIDIEDSCFSYEKFIEKYKIDMCI